VTCDVPLTDFLNTAVIVSCLSSFPALFRPSTSQKPVFSPSETYLRMMSRIRSSRNKSTGRGKPDDLTLVDISMVSRADGFDYVRAHEDSSTLAGSRGHDSQDDPILVPRETYQKPMAQCYRGETGLDHIIPLPQEAGQIRQEFEYKVTTNNKAN
jgi:hypothetical protein